MGRQTIIERGNVKGHQKTDGDGERRKRASLFRRFAIAGLFCGLITLAGSHGAIASPEEKSGPAPGKKPVKGIRIDHVDRDATESVAWIRVRVLSDTAFPETWAVIENVEQWAEFMDLYEKVERTPVEGPLDRYTFFVSPPWPLPEAQTMVRVMKNPKDNELNYWIEQGFMAGTYGAISVERDNGGSRLLFENLGPPNQRFPDWMVKMGVYLVLPSVLKEIRDRVRDIKEEAQKTPGIDATLPPRETGAPPGP